MGMLGDAAMEAELEPFWDRLMSKPPIERALLARELKWTMYRGLVEVHDAAVYAATRTQSYTEVGELLGVSGNAINKAITKHINAMRLAGIDV